MYISAADSVSKASASAAATADLIGFAVASATLGGAVQVQSAGVLAGFSGLTPGAQYFLDTTSGLITSTAPSGTGKVVIQAGFAKSATALQIQIVYKAKRS